MKGEPEILDILADVLAAELTAINQYFVHAKLCENWGFKKIAKKKREESIEEMRDAEAIMDRILYFDGVPNLQRMNAIKVGEDVEEQHRLDLEVEKSAVERLNKGIAICRDKGDNGTRELLESILKGEEEAVDWLETELHLIAEVGKERYLAEKIG